MKHLQEYIDNNRISVRSKIVDKNVYHITCYTKEQFFTHPWDDVTKSHRGLIYRDGCDAPINSPFPKIFNVGEQAETSVEAVHELMTSYHYEVLDKVNGHLVIVSTDVETGAVFVTTKGSFGGDLAEADEALIKAMGIYDVVSKMRVPVTFMFECLADYDKHLWYEDQLKRYTLNGENTMILLGAIHTPTQKSYDYDRLVSFSEILECPVTRRYTELEAGQLGALYDHKGIEGYVFHFPSLNFRFKVKTREYVQLHYMKELRAERFVNALANSGADNLYVSYDEELYPVVDAVIEDFHDYVVGTVIGDAVNYDLQGLTARDIAGDNSLNAVQKNYLFKGKVYNRGLIGSKALRQSFKENGVTPRTDAAIQKFFDAALYSTT